VGKQVALRSKRRAARKAGQQSPTSGEESGLFVTRSTHGMKLGWNVVF